MTEKITSKDYFFAAYKNPFDSPARIGVDSQKPKELRDREIKVLEGSEDNVPGLLKSQNKRMMLMFLVYIVSTALIIPLIVLTCIAYSTVKEVQASTDAAAANNSPAKQQKLHDLRMLFDRSTGYSSRVPPSPASSLSRSTSSSSLPISRSSSNSSFSSGPPSPASSRRGSFTAPTRPQPWGGSWGAPPVEEDDFGLQVIPSHTTRHGSFSSTGSDETDDADDDFMEDIPAAPTSPIFGMPGTSPSAHQPDERFQQTRQPDDDLESRLRNLQRAVDAPAAVRPRPTLTAQQERNRSDTFEMYDPAFSSQPSTQRRIDSEGLLLPLTPPRANRPAQQQQTTDTSGATVSRSRSNTQDSIDTTSTGFVDDDSELGFDPFGNDVDISTLEVEEDGFFN